jgi:hypothetical protein
VICRKCGTKSDTNDCGKHNHPNVTTVNPSASEVWMRFMAGIISGGWCQDPQRAAGYADAALREFLDRFGDNQE